MLRKYKLHCFLNINIKFSYCFLHLFYTKNLNVIEAERLQIENKEIQTQDFHSNFLFFFFFFRLLSSNSTSISRYHQGAGTTDVNLTMCPK